MPCAASICAFVKARCWRSSGPSGSGKSTLLNLLGAIETPTTGHVLLEGVDVATLNDTERTLIRRRRIGFIFQAFNLLPTLTAVENVALPLELDGMSESDARERAWRALELVDLSDRHDHVPSMMSGGEQQRVAVARALVIQPAIVLADEPTGNLDSVNSAQVMRLLRDLVDSRGHTVIIVTHDNDIAAQADRTVHVRDGKLEDGDVLHLRRPAPSRCEPKMMVNWKFAWREVRQRPSRAILTLLSIVIGVAAVVAVTIASGTSSRVFDQIFKTVAGKAQVEIAAPIGSSFRETLAPEIRELPIVQAVAPLMKRNTVLYVKKKQPYHLVVLGIDPKYDQEVRDYDIVAGKRLRHIEAPKPGQPLKVPPPSPDEGDGILLDEEFAHNAGVKLEEQVELLTRSGKLFANVVGFYKSRGAASMAEGSPIIMPLLATQHYFKSPSKIDSAQIVLKPGIDEAAAMAEIEKHVPEGITVRKPQGRSALAEETSLSTQQGMRMARAFALLVAVFIITNTFLINVTQRRKQLGIMRAIGGTRRQIGGMVFREALLMGVVGTILGSGLGVLAAHFLTRAMGALYQAKLPPIELTIWPFVVGTSCGLGISLVSAAIPARKASHLSPLEAMRDVRADELEGSSRWMVVPGAIFAICGVCIMAASIRGWLPMLHAVWASLLLLTGLVLMLPVVLRPFSSLAAYVFRRVIPVEGKLARLQLLRHYSRTTLTIGVVFIAISTGIGLASSVMDTVENVRNWYRKSIVADFFLRAESPSMATGSAASVPDTVGPEIRKVAGIVSCRCLGIRARKGGRRTGNDHSSRPQQFRTAKSRRDERRFVQTTRTAQARRSSAGLRARGTYEAESRR